MHAKSEKSKWFNVITSMFHQEPLEACALRCMPGLSAICTFQQDPVYEDKEPSSQQKTQSKIHACKQQAGKDLKILENI